MSKETLNELMPEWMAKQYFSTLGKMARGKTSEAKKAASRENLKKARAAQQKLKVKRAVKKEKKDAQQNLVP